MDDTRFLTWSSVLKSESLKHIPKRQIYTSTPHHTHRAGPDIVGRVPCSGQCSRTRRNLVERAHIHARQVLQLVLGDRLKPDDGHVHVSLACVCVRACVCVCVCACVRAPGRHRDTGPRTRKADGQRQGGSHRRCSRAGAGRSHPSGSPPGRHRRSRRRPRPCRRHRRARSRERAWRSRGCRWRCGCCARTSAGLPSCSPARALPPMCPMRLYA